MQVGNGQVLHDPELTAMLPVMCTGALCCWECWRSDRADCCDAAKGFLSDILRPKSHHSPSVVVSGVCLCPDGLLTCSLEGLVHFHKFL